MNDVHSPLPLSMSPDVIASGAARSDALGPRQGNITIVPPREHCAGSSKPRTIIELHDDGRVTLNFPPYPRGRGALILDDTEPSASDDAETCSDPPAFPSLAPYKDFRPAAWSYVMLFVATQLYTMRLGNRDALSGLEAQAQLLRNIATYICDELRVHLPCFRDKTVSQLQSILEHDPAFRDTMRRLVLNTDDELAMRTIVHYLLSRPSPAPPPPVNSVVSRTIARSPGRGASADIRSSQPAESQSQGYWLGVDDLEARSSANHDPSEAPTIPSFKPRLFKGLIEENTALWTNLVWNSGQLCRDIPATAVTIEALGQLVHAIVSRIHADSPGSAPLFEDVSPAQFSALLTRDPAFETAVRDLQAKASEPDYFAYCKALRLVVNHLCQKPKGSHRSIQRVRISSPNPE